MAPRPTLLVNLQICRALAAVTVVIGHSLHDADTIASQANLSVLQSQINWGFGVDLFFVISGFIMVHVSADDFAKSMAPWRFFSRRLTRIVPLYWTLTTLLIFGSFFAPQLLNVPIGGIGHIIDSYLFIPDLRAGTSLMRPVMALGWTLNYEMLFYVCFAASMVLPFNRAIALLTAVFVAMVWLGSAIHITQPQLAFWMDPLILEFLLGMYLATVYRAGWRLPVLGSAALALGAVASLTPGLVEAFGLTTNIHLIRAGIPAVMVVAAAALGPQAGASAITRFGTSLGDASYALYLIHPFVIRPMREAWSRLGLADWPLQIYCVVCVLGAVAAALALHIFYERPVTHALQKLLRRSRAQPLAVAPVEESQPVLAYEGIERLHGF